MDFVKKLIFGIALMALGTLGVTALLFGVLLTEPVSYNGFNGWPVSYTHLRWLRPAGCKLRRGP